MLERDFTVQNKQEQSVSVRAGAPSPPAKAYAIASTSRRRTGGLCWRIDLDSGHDLGGPGGLGRSDGRETRRSPIQ